MLILEIGTSKSVTFPGEIESFQIDWRTIFYKSPHSIQRISSFEIQTLKIFNLKTYLQFCWTAADLLEAPLWVRASWGSCAWWSRVEWHTPRWRSDGPLHWAAIDAHYALLRSQIGGRRLARREPNDLCWVPDRCLENKAGTLWAQRVSKDTGRTLESWQEI